MDDEPLPLLLRETISSDSGRIANRDRKAYFLFDRNADCCAGFLG